MKRSSSDETLSNLDQPIEDASLLDFWKWTYSYLSNDPTKGEFAEWMVGKLLGFKMEPGGRVEGRDWDLISPEGVKIEVKAAAYWQAWKLRNNDGTWKPTPDIASYQFPPATKIRFNGLWAAQTLPDGSGAKADFKSDLYVFCFQREKHPDRWDALDLSQWEFYLLPRDDLMTIKAKRDSSYKDAALWRSFGISLATLQQHSEKMDAQRFRENAPRLIEHLASQFHGLEAKKDDVESHAS